MSQLDGHVVRRSRSSNIIQLEILGRWMHRLSSWDRCCSVRMSCTTLHLWMGSQYSCKCLNPANIIYIVRGFAHLVRVAHARFGSLVGLNRGALVRLVEGSRCWWLYMLKVWVTSKRGKKKGRPCSFGHCSKIRTSLSIMCAWLISTRTRNRRSVLSPQVQIPIVVGKTIPAMGAAPLERRTNCL